MRLSLLLLAGLAAPASAAERRYPVPAFDRVRLIGSADVIVTAAPTHAVRATGAAADLDRLEVGVRNGELVIGQKSGMGWSREPLIVRVAAPALKAAALKGSGDIRIDRVNGPSFAGAVDGSGDLAIAAVDARAVTLSLRGSGDIGAAGRCGSASLALNGEGDIDAGALRCRDLNVALAGSGDVTAYASGSATLALDGSGDIRVNGGARCTTARRGSGDIRCS
jgi:hypothetical protein